MTLLPKINAYSRHDSVAIDLVILKMFERAFDLPGACQISVVNSHCLYRILCIPSDRCRRLPDPDKLCAQQY